MNICTFRSCSWPDKHVLAKCLCGTKLDLHSQLSPYPRTAVIEQLSGESLQYFSHGLEEWSVFIRPSDDIRLGGVANTGESRVRVQSDLEQPEGCIQIRDEERYRVCREEIKTLLLLSQDCWRVMNRKWPRIFGGLQIKCGSVRSYCKRDRSCFGLLWRSVIWRHRRWLTHMWHFAGLISVIRSRLVPSSKEGAEVLERVQKED